MPLTLRDSSLSSKGHHGQAYFTCLLRTISGQSRLTALRYKGAVARQYDCGAACGWNDAGDSAWSSGLTSRMRTTFVPDQNPALDRAKRGAQDLSDLLLFAIDIAVHHETALLLLVTFENCKQSLTCVCCVVRKAT